MGHRYPLHCTNEATATHTGCQWWGGCEGSSMSVWVCVSLRAAHSLLSRGFKCKATQSSDTADPPSHTCHAASHHVMWMVHCMQQGSCILCIPVGSPAAYRCALVQLSVGALQWTAVIKKTSSPFLVYGSSD